MPLLKSKSKKAFEHNLKAEVAAGNPMKQSLAIAYAMKRKKMSKGGMVEELKPRMPEKSEPYTEQDEEDVDLTPQMNSPFDEKEPMGDGDSDPWEAEYGSSELGNDDQDEARKGVLQRIMNKVRMRQMGR